MPKAALEHAFLSLLRQTSSEFGVCGPCKHDEKNELSDVVRRFHEAALTEINKPLWPFFMLQAVGLHCDMGSPS